MSNTKEILIQADVPWDWASRLPDSEAACFAGLLLNPVIGVQIVQQPIGYMDNEHGGRTSMYQISISGAEALAYPFLRRLVEALDSVGTVITAMTIDLENPSGWEDIETGERTHS